MTTTPVTPGPGPAANPLPRAVLGECGRALIPLAAFGFAINLLVLAVPLFMLQVFDRVMGSHNTDTLTVLAVSTLGALGFMAALDLIRSRLLVRTGAWLDRRLGEPACRAAIAGGGDAGPLRDLARLRAFLSGPDVVALLDAPWAPLFIALIYVIHPTLGFIALGGAAALLLVAWLNDALTRPAMTRAGAASARALAGADEWARQGEAARALGMTGSLTARWRQRQESVLATQATASDRAGTLMAISRWLRLALQVLIVAAAAVLVLGQEVSIGAMIAVSIILARALSPVEQAIGLWRNVAAAQAAWTRLKARLAATPDTDRTPLPRPVGRLAVDAATLRHAGAEAPLLEDAAFAVEPGELVGLTGASGIGKSTLLRLLAGIEKPDRGAVRLDGADVTDWPADDRGRYVGYLPQDPALMAGTVRDNIARFTDAPAEVVHKAARAAGLHDLILRLPHGYDTWLETGGRPLSGGARQRLALARALFGDPVVLILDEPYSNLDRDGVEALITAIEAARTRGAAVVMAAHRPSLLARADRVLTLSGGRIESVEPQRRTPLRLLSCESAEPVRESSPGTTADIYAVAG